MIPFRFKNPKMISIRATPSSRVRPARVDITMRKMIITPPTKMIVRVCPSPQSIPINAALRTERFRLTMVVTAMT